ncbi:MAG: transketolase [Acidimicrobiia bacterium]|nr:transketolase [Acidimicrobiia bacterium]
MSRDIEQLAADAIRVLSIDAVQQANSGHPGMPMGMADLAVVLWSKFLTVDPDTPDWVDRDRFVLSNGHGSMLLYSMLHLTGFPLSMDDLRNFRQWGSPTAGHPEIEQDLGIEMTTGPLGQGLSTAVGMAVAETNLSARFGSDVVDHHTYVFCSDGDLMEGVASEAASLAGHWKLGKLIAIYDDNSITLEGPTDWTFHEDVPARFQAYGWHTITVDGHDRDAIATAITSARTETDRPTLISAKTHIGYGSPNKQDKASAHGSPLGADEIALVKEGIGWELPPFEVPAEVYDFFRAGMERGRQARRDWERRTGDVFAANGDMAELWESFMAPQPVTLHAPSHEAGTSAATRSLSGEVIQELALHRPDLLTGDADLAGSTKSPITGADAYGVRTRTGANVRYGVREHAMGAIVNGINLHGGLRAFGSTFLQFSDYMRGAVRLGALMGLPSIWVWTHDSVFLGEDGPTHQPVEHVAALRTIPNLWVFRPGSPAETAGAWQSAINRTDGPSALILTRQNLPIPTQDSAVGDVARGGYVVRDGTDVTLVATGSELWLAMAAAQLLADGATSARVVSMPCVEAFKAQSLEYQGEVIGDLPAASIEAGVTAGWSDIVGSDGLKIGIDHFGASAPAEVLAEHYGLTPTAVADRVADWLA